jgi:hypothetical protein
MLTSIHGIWGLKSRKNSSDREILYIYPDGRLVQFMRSRRDKSNPVPFKLRVFPDGDSKFKIAAKADAKGWPAEVQDDGTHLMIKPPIGSKAVWSRVSQAELPEWFESALSSVVWD